MAARSKSDVRRPARPMPRRRLEQILQAHALWLAAQERSVTPPRGAKPADFTAANLQRAYLVGADLRLAEFVDADLRGANLQGADLRGARFWFARMGNANLQGADLRGASLGAAELLSANLQGAQLERAHMTQADLDAADLRGANLREAILAHANLYRADAENACLEGADLRGADLEGANLEGANLRGAHLKGAKLLDVVLQNAVMDTTVERQLGPALATVGEAHDSTHDGISLERPATRQNGAELHEALADAEADQTTAFHQLCDARVAQRRLLDTDPARASAANAAVARAHAAWLNACARVDDIRVEIAEQRQNGDLPRARIARNVARRIAAERGGAPAEYLREASDRVLQVPSELLPPANPRARSALDIAVQMAVERGGHPMEYLREAWEQTARRNSHYIF